MIARLKEISVKDGLQHANDNKKGSIRPLDQSDPRGLDHPSHKEKWFEIAGVLGRAMADKDFDRFGERGTR